MSRGVVTESAARTIASRRTPRIALRGGHGLTVGKTVVKARKQAGMKLELRKARRDQSSGARAACRLLIDTVHPAIANVYAENHRLIALCGRASSTQTATTARRTATVASDAETMCALSRVS
jgi:hypothetical protein